LSKNGLSDLSALYLKDALARPGAVNITKLNMSKNPDLKSKTGIFIGESLISNPDHPIEKLKFKNIYLEDDGLIRILEACNTNKNIKSVTLGYVSSTGLKLMAKTLKINKTLEKLKF
jgi:hypothetical protein